MRPAPVVGLEPHRWPSLEGTIARSRYGIPLLLLLSAAVVRPVSGSALLPARAPAPAPMLSRDERASQLLAHAERLLSERTIDQRRLAIHDLETAEDLAPGRADVEILLARAYYQAGFLKQARKRFEQAMALAPNDAQARLGLGNMWRRDWMKYLERRSLDRAVEHYAAAGRLDSNLVEAWLMLSALQVERHDLPAARAAAAGALQADRGRAESMLAGASTRWRVGDVAGADSLFRLALSHLRQSVRERFEDFAPLATERDTMEYRRLPPAMRPDFERRFWREHDPDLATPENEAQLEYWARVAQAYFLYYDSVHRRWDERGEVYVRYGPPDSVAYNPLGTSLYGRIGSSEHGVFPLNALVWTYATLGMSVLMQDRLLSERYELPISMDEDLDPTPDPDSVAAAGLMATHGLRGVFPLLPPGSRPLAVAAQWASFESETGRSRMYAGVSAPGEPGDTLAADFVVLDSTLNEIHRMRSALSPSACAAATLRVADFSADLPAGQYTLGLSVRGGGRRGAARETVTLPAPDSSLAMSDLVVTCGVPFMPQTSVRLNANPAGLVPPHEPLVAYFEVYHLARGADGQGRFEYETSVHSAKRDPRVWLQRWLSPRREGQELGVTRQDAVLGTVRRQFVSVPVQSLVPGRYRLDITVRDVLTGEAQKRSAEFTRAAEIR